MARERENVEYLSCDFRDPRDKDTVDLYTGDFGYYYLNRFLSKRDSLDVYQSSVSYAYTLNFYHYITGSNDRQMNLPFLHSVTTLPEVMSHWNEIEWFQNIYFQFTLDLYRIISYCPSLKENSVVYRGVLRHYMKEDPSKAYPITTFLSTSISKDVAIGFYDKGGAIYIFHVMPDVPCLYFGYYEKELIINPYVYCSFVKKEIVTDPQGNKHREYYYTLFSSPIVPPNTFEEFMEFRDSIIGHYSLPMEGGSVETEMMEPVRNVNTNRSRGKNILTMSRRKRNNVTKRASSNQKVKSSNKMRTVPPELARLHARSRLTAPIGIGSKGIPLTKKMKEMVQHSRTLFDSLSTRRE